MRRKLLLLLSAAVLLTSCTSLHHSVVYMPETKPEVNWVYLKGETRSSAGNWPPYQVPNGRTVKAHRFNSWLYHQSRSDAQKCLEYFVNSDDIKKGFVQLPTLILEARGYLPFEHTPGPIKLDDAFYNNILSKIENPGYHSYWHGYRNTETIALQPDPSYVGPETPNEVKVTINSEPQGARVYENGRLLGTTPYVATYKIRNDHYQTGVLHSAPLIAIHDACLPAKQELKLKIEPDWRYDSGETHHYATLFILQRDPNYRPPVIVRQNGGGSGGRESNVNMNVKQEKDFLDIMQQAGTVMTIIKSLDAQ